ncbi:MAG: sigma-54-dependent Fis family transcriptional regulator [Thermodesulfobacteriales bacterium]|nr:MAG: sigma-54-dependent Fis family transcriptional regulator [Thermodesulfobacteriales bacterium]
MAVNNKKKTIDENAALLMILEGTATETGEAFFKALVENLAKALNMKGAWVTEYLEKQGVLRSIAFWLDDALVDEYEYKISGTPCESVIEEKRLVHVPENVVTLYPDDPDLEPFDAVSYVGVPLLDIDGTILGHLAVLDSKPMPEEPRGLTIFRIFASRACAELRRLRAESEIHQREEKLGRLVDSAMDAIIELNCDGDITMMNLAAEKIFMESADKLIGENLSSLFSKESAYKLTLIIDELIQIKEGDKFLWIPGGLSARGSDDKLFQAEATISHYELGTENFFTIILRNVNDRLLAENKIKALSSEAEYLKEEIKSLLNFDEIIGNSKALQKVFDEINQVSGTDATILITGETGTGKELIARAIHAESKRSNNQLIKVNCAAIPAALIESEFFGHIKGAYTGATSDREGRFALADRGTIFLDEIGELPLDLQSKLLRVLQEGEFEPVGSSQTIKVNVRVICATNRNLLETVNEGKFRQDLFYRLNVFPIEVPALRERGDDIIKLASSFSEKSAHKMGINISPLSDEDMMRFKLYQWPGNVRELQNVIERAVITSRDGKLNLDQALPEMPSKNLNSSEEIHDGGSSQVRTAKEILDIERSNIILALESTSWRVSGDKGAAALLGIPSTTLSSRIKALGIERKG